MTELRRNRTTSDLEDDIQRLREWLSKQPHLPQNIDNELLVAYVHGTRSLEIAKQKIDSYYTSKLKAPQLFSFPARDPSDSAFKLASGATKIFFLPRMTTERHVVLMVTFDMDFAKFDHKQYLVRLMMMLELAMLRWPDMAGIEFVSDVEGLDSSLLTKLSVTSGAFFVHWFQSTIPMKLKRGVAVNTPKFFETVVNTIIKPFLKKKIFDRLVFTSEDKKAVKNYVSEDLLPIDYGGKEISSEDMNNYWLNELQKYRDWFLKTAQQIADEGKRPSDKGNTYGVEGTFRSLRID